MDPQLAALLNGLTQLIRDQQHAAAQAAQDREYDRRQKQLLHAETEDYIDSIVQGRRLNEEQKKIEQKLRAAKEKELKLRHEIDKAMRHHALMVRTYGANHQHTITAQRLVTHYQNQHTKSQVVTNKVTQQLTNSFRGLIKGVNLAGAALTYLTASIKNTVNQYRDQMVANQGVIEGMDYFTGVMSQGGQAFLRGIDAVEFAKMTTANRQMINAMGGTTNTLAHLDSSVLDFYTMTGSHAEATKIAMEAMSSMAQKGVKPTENALRAYTADVKTLAKQTGMSADAAAQFYNSIHDDIDSMTLLRAARADEREAILQNQRAMVQNAIAAGMTAEQAKEAAKMLNKMVAAKPLERIKQAAKIRAMGGALGIAGANEAAAAVLAGPRATEQQRQQLMQFSQSAANTVDQAAQLGQGAEIFASTLVDKLGLEQQYGPGSVFSTTLGDVMAKSVKEVGQMYSEASSSAMTKALFYYDRFAQQLEALVKGAITWNGILTGVNSILKFLNGENSSNWIYEALSESFPNAMRVFGDKVVGMMGDKLSVMIDDLLALMAGGLGSVFSAIPFLSGAGESLKNYSKEKTKQADETRLRMSRTLNNFDPMVDTSASPKLLNQPAPNAKVDVKVNSTDAASSVKSDQAAKAVLDSATASRDTASGIQNQLKKMDENAALLQKLVTNSEKSVELAEKQLVALTLTEKERADSSVRQNLRRDNRFGAKYGYLN